MFYKGAHGIFLVYDITSNDSFKKAKYWLGEARQNVGPNVLIILIGNKLDEENKREVKKEDAQKFAENEKLDGFIETSAKSGENARIIFLRTAKFLYNQHKSEILDDKIMDESEFSLQKKVAPKNEKNCAC